MKKIVFSMGLSLTILTGCMSISQKNDSNMDNANLLAVEFVGNGTFTVPKQQGTVSLYAVESQMADVPATLILQKHIQVSQVPFMVDFELPANHKKKIQPPVSDNAEITYYVTWESDGKNKGNQGAIAIDYNRKFPQVTLGSGQQKIYLRDVK
ncbi:hypothetical protein [Acinetobacter sp. ANC 4648]|uniref:hypothetical protein n=1 Tax=Acinetobacter sp. ANC 4648 TaxID=1977875 RepID=UPI000A32E964|nr:hypothetical protein [Acinetobacter sp. ANC 4648]OTG80637.1 hypothetical protein B9T27_12225 [Acinetobacter sp. ANC 4648]